MFQLNQQQSTERKKQRQRQFAIPHTFHRAAISQKKRGAHNSERFTSAIELQL